MYIYVINYKTPKDLECVLHWFVIASPFVIRLFQHIWLLGSLQEVILLLCTCSEACAHRIQSLCVDLRATPVPHLCLVIMIDDSVSVCIYLIEGYRGRCSIVTNTHNYCLHLSVFNGNNFAKSC